MLLLAILWNSAVCFLLDGFVRRTQIGALSESGSLVRAAVILPTRAALLELHATFAATEVDGCGSGLEITATKNGREEVCLK